MDESRLLSSESFSYSLRLSLDSEAFIEFDPRLMSMRWSIKTQEGEEAFESSLDLDSIPFPPLFSLDSTRSLFSRSSSSRHQSGRMCAAASTPVSFGLAQSKSSGNGSSHHKFGLALQKYLRFVLMKICRRLKLASRAAGDTSAKQKTGTIERGRGNKVFDADTENSISDAVLHCKNSNLGSLMNEECKD